MIGDFFGLLGNALEVITIKPLIGLFKADGVPPLIALVIVLAGVFCIRYYRKINRRDLILISGAREIIEHYQDKFEFADKIEDIDLKFRDSEKHQLFKHAWDEFRETTIDPAGDTSVIRNTARPHDFFNLHDLHLDRHLTRVLPHIFVGVGLLLTFIGLIAALTEARDVFDDKGAQTALKNLLQVASAKFYASVAGLSMSLVMTVYFRGHATKVENELRMFCRAIENKMNFVTMASLTDQILTQEKYQSLQLNNLRQSSEEHVAKMVSDLAENLSGAMVEASKIFTEQLAKTTAALEILTVGIEKSGTQMREDISAATAELTKGIEESGGTLKQSAFDSSSELKEGSTQMREDISAAVSELTECVDEMGETLKTGGNEVSKVMEQGADSMRETLKEISEAAPEYCYIHVQAIEHAINKLSNAVSTAKKNALK